MLGQNVRVGDRESCASHGSVLLRRGLPRMTFGALRRSNILVRGWRTVPRPPLAIEEPFLCCHLRLQRGRRMGRDREKEASGGETQEESLASSVPEHLDSFYRATRELERAPEPSNYGQRIQVQWRFPVPSLRALRSDSTKCALRSPPSFGAAGARS